MYTNIVPLNSVTHAQLKLSSVQGFSFAKKNHLCSVVLHELLLIRPMFPQPFGVTHLAWPVMKQATWWSALMRAALKRERPYLPQKARRLRA